jgi:RNA polymerase sigma factor (TIGR02999 family)
MTKALLCPAGKRNFRNADFLNPVEISLPSAQNVLLSPILNPSGNVISAYWPMTQATSILERARQGDPKAAEELFPLVYQELRELAAAKMAREKPGQTLQPTALVHEAWLRLAGDASPQFQSRAHFFGAAAEAMRRILIERARRRLAAKRGAGAEQIDVDEIEIASPVSDDDTLLALNEALEKFSTLDARKADLVKLRYFIGMNYEEAADALGIAVPTAKQWWAYARAWLAVEMRGNAPR